MQCTSMHRVAQLAQKQLLQAADLRRIGWQFGVHCCAYIFLETPKT